MTTFHIITLFPNSFDSYLGESILKRAIEDKKIKVKFYNPRDFVKNKWHRVDQRPYGGGPGMVIEALPVINSIEKAMEKAMSRHESADSPAGRQRRKGEKDKSRKSAKPNAKIIYFSPGGKQFTNEYADKLSKNFSDMILICGRYEGIDARVNKAFKMDDVSVGPFVLTGGELPAMIVIDSVARRVPGVLGDISSLEENRVSCSNVYTRPEIIEYKGKKFRVPKVLLSGHRANIEKWKSKNSSV